MRRHTCISGARCSSGTIRSCRGLLSLVGTSRASSTCQPSRTPCMGPCLPLLGRVSFWLAPSPAAYEGPASTAICASCLVGDDPGDHPTSSNFLASSILLLILSGVWGLWWCLGFWLGLGPHLGSTSLLPTSRYNLGLCHTGMEKSTNQSLDRLCGRCAPFPFTKQVIEVF